MMDSPDLHLRQQPTGHGAESPAGATTRVEQAVVRDIAVLSVIGLLERSALLALDARLRCEDVGPTIIDLGDCTITDRTVLEGLDHERWNLSEDTICVACRRLSGRRLLASAHVTERLTVFGQVEDAIQARVLEQAGFGSGWSREDDS